MNEDYKLYKDIIAMMEKRFDKFESKLESMVIRMDKRIENIYTRFNKPVEMNTFFRKAFIMIFMFIVPVIITLIFKIY